MTIKSPTGAYAGICNSDRLAAAIETFVANIRNRVPQDQNALAVDILEHILDETIVGLFDGLCDAAKLEGVGRKTVNMTLATTRATCQMLSRRVLKGMKNDDLRKLAEHLDDLRMTITDAKGNKDVYTVVPLNEKLLEQVLGLHKLIRAESPPQHMRAIQGMLSMFMEAVLEHVYVRTLASLRLGPIIRKVVDLGYRTAHSGTETLINRVVPHLSDQQVLDASDFLVSLVVYPHAEAA